MRYLCLSVALIAALTAVADARVPRLRRMVVVGDSLLAGFGSGGFVGSGHPGQIDGAAAFVARRAGVRLPLPTMTRPGVPPQLMIVDDNGNGRLDPGEVRRTESGLGFRADSDKHVRNLAVPGEDITSVFEKIAPEDVAAQLASGDLKGRDALKFLILGLPLQSEAVSQVSRAREIHPSFILVWIGNNDVLDMATQTNPGAATMSAADFGTRFRALLDALADTQAGMAVANLPDPTGIAALRRAGTDVTSCRRADGTIEPVAPDDRLSIDLDPAMLPVPPCARVLSGAERTQVRATIAAFNAEIATAIAAVEQARGVTIASVDVFQRFDDLAANGVDVTGDGVPDLDTRYLGGIFSLDGIHPTRTGNALVANTFIDAIDARFGVAIPRVEVNRVASHDPLAHSRFRPTGEVPFGVIGGDSADEVADFFPRVFARIEASLGDLRDHLKDFFGNLF